MLGSHTSWILQAQRGEIRTSGEVTPNFPSAPARKFAKICLSYFGEFDVCCCVWQWWMDAKYLGCVCMKKILDYIKSVRSEWFKIVWPSRDAVIRATIMILIFSGLAALFFFVVDSGLNALVGWIF